MFKKTIPEHNIYRKDISVSEIIETINIGWQKALKFVEYSQSEDKNLELKPEYLITVKIADSIVENLIVNPVSNFSLILEGKTSDAYERRKSEINLTITKNRIVEYIFRKKSDSNIRKGKFDIVLYKKEYLAGSDQYRTYSVIEVKNIKFSNRQLMLDILRINEIIKTNNNSDNYQLNYGILTFSEKVKKDLAIRMLFCNDSLTEIEKLVENRKLKYHQKLDLKENMSIETFVMKNKIENEDCYTLSDLYIIYNVVINGT